jgi:hypothetical protein
VRATEGNTIFILQFFVKIFFRVTNAESHMRRDGAFVATILCDAREEEMEENMEQVGLKQRIGELSFLEIGHIEYFKSKILG